MFKENESKERARTEKKLERKIEEEIFNGPSSSFPPAQYPPPAEN